MVKEIFTEKPSKHESGIYTHQPTSQEHRVTHTHGQKPLRQPGRVCIPHDPLLLAKISKFSCLELPVNPGTLVQIFSQYSVIRDY